MARFKTKKIIKAVEPLSKSEIRFVAGFDLSLTSSACAIYDLQLKKWYICAFTQKAREDVKFYYATANAEVWLLDALPETHNDVLRYIHVEEHLMKFVCEHIPAQYRKDQTDVRIEQYAFVGPEHAGHSYKLHEIGGIIKRALWKHGFPHVTPVVVGAWKRTVVGKGNCTKLDVVQFIATHGPKINFLTILGYDESTLAKDEKNQAVVPCPAQDFADASAIAMAAFTTRKSKQKQLAEIIATKAIMSAICVKGKPLAMRKVNIKKRKPKLTVQPAFLPPTQDSSNSFWASPKHNTNKKVKLAQVGTAASFSFNTIF